MLDEEITNYSMDPIVRLDKVNIYRCRICSHGSLCQQTYTNHITSHSSQSKVILLRATLYKCDMCSRAFDTNRALKLHSVAHVIKKVSITKKKCDKIRLKNAIVSRRKPKKYVKDISCNHCDMVCKPLEMRKHGEEMHGDFPHTCRHCYLRFSTSHQSEEHKNNIHRTLPCTICDKRLMTKESLSSHMKLHQPNQTQYSCSVCGKSFTQKVGLNNHLKIHTHERNFECKYCSKKFFSIYSIQTHERIHTGHKPYACQHCNKPFSDQSALKRHERIHTKDYRYFCTECPKKFTDASAIIRHRLKHGNKTTASKFQCEICKIYFCYNNSLQVHKLISHLDGEYEYECDLCGLKFATKSYLYNHVTRVHTPKFECAYCGKMFIDKKVLQNHKNKHHPITLYCSTCPQKFCSEKKFQAHKLVCVQKNSRKG